jgi:putative transcriptional regulator
VTFHHPYDDTLARYAAARLSAGPSLVVSTHLGGCAECRSRVGLFEAAGGALLEDAPVAALRPDLFAAALARIDAPEEIASPRRRLSSPLDGVVMSPWRSVGGGFQWRRLTLPHAPEANVMMIKVQPGQRMPHHTHVGTEYTQVMQGAFHDDFGRYVAGDCVEADDDVNHQPIVDSDDECICLAAVEGRLRFRGWLARMVQPFIGL